MTDSGRPASRAAIADFLEMLAAERGAAKNTLDAYARDLGDYVLGLARRGRDPMTATIQDIRDYLSALAEAGAEAHVGGAQTFGDPAISSLPRGGGAPARRSRRFARRPAPGPAPAEDPVHRRGRFDPARLPRRAGRSRPTPGRTFAGAPRRLSGRGALRLWPARVGTGGVDAGRGETGRKAARNRAAASSPFAARADASASRP